MLLIYPICEAVFSIWRKKFVRTLNPDGMHFHMLIYKRIVKAKFKKINERLKNSFVISIFMVYATFMHSTFSSFLE